MEDAQDRTVQAEKTIRKYVWGAAGIGLLPFPLVDLAGIMAVHLKLVHDLAVLYEAEFSVYRVKVLLAALVGSGTSMLLSQRISSVLKFLPFVGSSLAFLSTSGLGAATTYAVGRVFVLHFEAGGTLLDFDPQAMREYYAEQLAAQVNQLHPSAAEKSSAQFFAGIKP